jgi:PIN domain nuclease of toxin-antitoxin system
LSFLLDTNVFIWAERDPRRLDAGVRALLEDTSNQIFISVASIWEMSIKVGMGRLHFPRDFEQMLSETLFTVLPISMRHAILAGTLPKHHHDPFDRMLIAQAMVENLTLLTGDRALLDYGAFVRLV